VREYASRGHYPNPIEPQPQSWDLCVEGYVYACSIQPVYTPCMQQCFQNIIDVFLRKAYETILIVVVILDILVLSSIVKVRRTIKAVFFLEKYGNMVSLWQTLRNY